MQRCRRPNVTRLDALNHVIAAERRSDLPPDFRAAAITSDEIAALDRHGYVRIEIARVDPHAVFVLFVPFVAGTAQDFDARRFCRMAKQDRLEVDLVDSVRGLGCRPERIGSVGGGETVPPAGDPNACQFMTGRTSADGYVMWIVIGKARGTDVAGETQASKSLHGSGRDMIALDARRLVGPSLFYYNHFDSAPSEVQCEGEPYGSASSDGDAGSDA